MTTDLLPEFIAFLQQQCRVQPTDRLLVAVSGGIDSMVLLDLCQRANQPIAIAHCNFALRGEASFSDEAFVTSYANHRQLPVFSTTFDTLAIAAESHQSLQMVARQLRYQWLHKIRRDYNFAAIATAHHQNDVMETVLYNLTKGTGIAGIHGIAPRRNSVVRPLLFADKKAITQYAELRQIAYREDISNSETKYTRNKIRHLVVPVLERINPSVVQTFARNARRFAETEAVFQTGIEYYRKKLFDSSRHRNDILISIGKLKKITPLSTVLYELLKPYHFNATQVDQIIAALDGTAGKIFISSTHQLIKDRRHLILSELQSLEADHFIIQSADTSLRQPHAYFSLFTLSASQWQIQKNAHTLQTDADKLQFPLLLRRWQKGDYFYPFGMGMKKKKLSRYFIDQKMSLADKQNAWVLLDHSGRMVWLVGHRADERFAVTPTTQHVWVMQPQNP